MIRQFFEEISNVCFFYKLNQICSKEIFTISANVFKNNFTCFAVKLFLQQELKFTATEVFYLYVHQYIHKIDFLHLKYKTN